MKYFLKISPKFLYIFFSLDVVCTGKDMVRRSNEWLKKTVAPGSARKSRKQAQQFLTQYNSQTLMMNEQKGDAYALWS
jgi:hypothetical protein